MHTSTTVTTSICFSFKSAGQQIASFSRKSTGHTSHLTTEGAQNSEASLQTCTLMLFHIPLTKASLMVKPNFSGKGKYTPPKQMVGRGVKIE